MAHLIPNRDKFSELPQPLRRGEETLVDALATVLDDNWTIYVQPHVNGLNPDVVIFSPLHGIAIFEVKEWSLGMYKIEMLDDPNLIKKKSDDPNSTKKTPSIPKYRWIALKEKNDTPISCPFEQVERYKDAIYRYEIPSLSAETVSNKGFYSLINTFVYFSGFTSLYLQQIPHFQKILGKYRYALGDDDIQPECLAGILQERKLTKYNSRFSKWMQDNKLTIQNAFYPPQYGKTDLKYLNDEPTHKQKELLPNTPKSKRRVLGSAGSGKTFILVRKALHAARNNQRVLFVTFNITMANLLRDLVFRLSRYYGEHVHRYIEIAHYHRLKYGTTDEMTGQEDVEQSTLSTYGGNPVDVLLIDEGQDFEEQWVEELLGVCKKDAHVMFVEDDRQNIYNRPSLSSEKFEDTPKLLRETHRVPTHLSKLANALYDYYKLANTSGALEPIKKNSKNAELFPAIWLNANDYAEARDTLFGDLSDLWLSGRFGQPSDNAILLCQVNHGWDVEDWLSRNIPAPRNRMFESKAEGDELCARHRIKVTYHTEVDTEDLTGKSAKLLGLPAAYYTDLSRLRRKYKILFRMRTDGIKLSTIHSFKGWELDHIFILFSPDERQFDSIIPLLYTALTRSQNNVTIYNASPKLKDFGEYAIAERLVRSWQPIR
jgi:thymidine kinase